MMEDVNRIDYHKKYLSSLARAIRWFLSHNNKSSFCFFFFFVEEIMLCLLSIFWEAGMVVMCGAILFGHWWTILNGQVVTVKNLDFIPSIQRRWIGFLGNLLNGIKISWGILKMSATMNRKMDQWNMLKCEDDRYKDYVSMYVSKRKP